MNQIQKKEFLPANQKSADYIYKKILLRMHVFLAKYQDSAINRAGSELKIPN